MSGTDRLHLGGGLISVLGVVITVAQLWPLFQLQEPPAVLVVLLFPVLLGGTLIGIGVLTTTGILVERSDVVRFAGWIVAGMVIFLLTGVWILLLEVILGYPTPYGSVLTVNAVALGGLVGAVIGLYDAQNNEYTRKLKARERELEEQNQRLDEFASIVSHDLRNPLNVATMRLALLREDSDSDHLSAIDDALDRMELIIEETLTLARDGRHVDEPEPIALADLADQSWQSVESDGAEFRVDESTRIRADHNQARHVFENLFRNAIEHNDGDVTVRVGALADGFYVADDGDGIPEEEREQVFEAGHTTTQAGTGLGLAITEEIVAAHDWEIAVTESNTGGARFEITGVKRVE